MHSKCSVLKGEFKTAKAFAEKSLCSFADISLKWEIAMTIDQNKSSRNREKQQWICELLF